jgi:hypothetical protein
LIKSAWGLGVLEVGSGANSKPVFTSEAVAAYDWLSLTRSIQIVGAGKFDQTDRQRLLFKMPPPPTVQLWAKPASIPGGDSSTLTWSSTNANRCSGTLGWAWTGGSPSGMMSVSPRTSTSYIVTCTGEGGSAAASVLVTVTAAQLSSFFVF